MKFKKAFVTTGSLIAAQIFTCLALQDSLPVVGSLFQFAFVIGIPGMLLALLLGLQASGRLNFILYSVGLSILLMMAGGLLLNFLLPLLGTPRPLSLLPLVTFYDALVIILATLYAVCNRNRPDPKEGHIKLQFNRQDLILAGLPFLFVPLAAAGATSLNNNGPNYATMLLLAFIAIYVVCVGWIRRKPAPWVYPVALLNIGASLLLMYALRSWHILGADIHLEFQVFSAVASEAQWYVGSAIDTAYNACLSITIVPTVLAAVTHLQPEYVYKLLIQLLFALAPVMIYALCRLVLLPRPAFLAGFVFAAQTWFIEQMPALIRQEVALLFFILVAIVLFDRALAKSRQYLLFGVFTTGIVVSHYSTAYVYISLLLVALFISLALRFWSSAPVTHRSNISVPKLLLALALVVLWQGVVTRAGSSLATFTKTAATHASEAFTAESLTKSVNQLALAGPAEDRTAELAKEYQSIAQQYASNKPRAYAPYPDAAILSYQPSPIDRGMVLDSWLPPMVTKIALGIGRLSKLLIVNLLGVVGLAVLLWRLRKIDDRSRDYIYLALACVPLLAGIIFLPIASESYNTTRLFLQSYIILVGPVIFGGLYLLHKIFKVRSELILTLLIAVFFLHASGFMYQIFGGPATLTLNQPGQQIDSYYVNEAEAVGARWLGLRRGAGVPVYADAMAKYRLQSFGGVPESDIVTDIFPLTIGRDSYVYMGHENTVSGVAYHVRGNKVFTYQYPTTFLDNYKNAIYSNGSATIYR